MVVRTWITRLMPSAFATLTQAFVLIMLVGIVSASAAHSHQAEAFAPVAVQDSKIATLHQCCHGADQSGQHSECAMWVCCSLSALAGSSGRDMPLDSASKRPQIGPMGFVGQSHPPILHPPITV